MRLSAVTSPFLLALALTGLVLTAGCKGNDNNGNPGLYPFQLPINTGLDTTRLDPVLTSIRLEPGGGLDIQLGTGIEVRAIGTFSDGLVTDITDLTTFTQTNFSVGSLSSNGRFVAQNTGQTTIYGRVNQIYSDALFVRAVNLITTRPSAVQDLDGVILPGNRFRLTWAPSPSEENVIGYVIYRARTSAEFTFKQADSDPNSPQSIQADPIPGTIYTDETAVGGVVYYVVQAIRKDVNDPDARVYGRPSRQLKVNFATGEVGED